MDFIQEFLPNAVNIEDETVDLIYALDVLEHIEDDQGSAKKMFNLLKKDGGLVLAVPARMDMWSYNDVWNHHFRRYEKEGLIHVLKKDRFEIERCSYYNSLLFPAAYAVRKIEDSLHIDKADIKDTLPLINWC